MICYNDTTLVLTPKVSINFVLRSWAEHCLEHQLFFNPVSVVCRNRRRKIVSVLIPYLSSKFLLFPSLYSPFIYCSTLPLSIIRETIFYIFVHFASASRDQVESSTSISSYSTLLLSSMESNLSELLTFITFWQHPNVPVITTFLTVVLS